jgi:tRNA 2-selenouridine synthase
MIQRVSVLEFLSQSPEHLIIDVRSPLEFEQGHIPGAKNIALFSDEERAVVGTLYKQAGKQQAILQGLHVVGPKLATFVQVVQNLTDKKAVFVYCWRGGMRSGSFAWLLQTYGYEVFVLQGGYKTYRNFALQQFLKNLTMRVVTGKTGVGKTVLLHEFARQGKQIIDLEGLARHKGSVFGGIGQQQPTQEQFENDLALLMHACNSDEPTWIEDESRKIGKIIIPAPLWQQMRQAVLLVVEKSYQQRLNLLMQEYGSLATHDLLYALQGVAKHLGSERCAQAQALLLENDRIAFCVLLMEYYDKAYENSFAQRNLKFCEPN